MYKLLTPNGNLLTLSQIYRLDITQVFNMLVNLGIPPNIKSKRTRVINKKHNFTLVKIVSINN